MTESPDAGVVIVGGGLAGLAVAAELDARGAERVVVIEAGPDGDREHYRWTMDESAAIQQWLDPVSDKHFWRPYRTDGHNYAGISGLRKRVGGRSLYWHGVTLPIEPWALTSWPEPVVRDLVTGWDGGLPLYQRIAHELSRWTGHDITEPPDAAKPVVFGDYAFAPVPQAVHGGADGRWQAYSPLAKWADDVRVPLLADSRVLGVVLDGDRVAGVRVERDGTTTDIAASTVVLAAGTVENSRLAIQALTETGRLAQPRLTGLADKVAQGFNACFELDTLPPDLADAARAGTFAVTEAAPGLRSNLFIILYVNCNGVAVLDTWLMGEQLAGDAAAVECEPAAEWPWPTTVVGALSATDQELVTAQRVELCRVWTQFLAAVRADGPALEFGGDFGSPDLPDLLLAPRLATGREGPRTYSFPLGAEQHEAGTTPLGTLLDDDHQFLGVPGLYAAGPSSFPRSGAANPTMTTLALAVRLARRLA